MIMFRNRINDLRLSAACDRDYIEHWTTELGLVNLWQEITHD